MNTKSNTQTNNKQSEIVAVHQEFSGPIPPPSVLEHYQKIYPNAPEEIFEMAKKQQNHRHIVVKNVVETTTKLENTGQIFGFILTIFILALSAFALYLGYEKFSIVAMTFVLLPLLKIFLFGKKKTSEQ